MTFILKIFFVQFRGLNFYTRSFALGFVDLKNFDFRQDSSVVILSITVTGAGYHKTFDGTLCQLFELNFQVLRFYTVILGLFRRIDVVNFGDDDRNFGIVCFQLLPI